MNSIKSTYTYTSKTQKDFYEAIGLKDYPFNVYTAENETDYASEIFVHPLNYDSIKSSFNGNRSIIIRGNRGTGKTALLNDLSKHVDKNSIVVEIDDYSDVPVIPSNSNYYQLLICNLVKTLFYSLFDDKKRLCQLQKDDKLFLSFLLKTYTSTVTKSELIRKIEAIQLSAAKRFFKKHINLFRAILNYGLTAGLNVVNDVLRNYYGVLPPVEESQIRNIIPELKLEADTEFNKANSSYSMLLRICNVINKLGYKRVIVFFDKFDEDTRMENNADKISTFFSPLLTDNKLLENTNIQIIVSVWEVPFNKILTQFRSQKHHCPILLWTEAKLRDALNRRLYVFSNGAIEDFTTLFSADVTAKDIDEIFALANGNPRDLWHIFHCIFQAQYAIDPESHTLSIQAIDMGLKDFVTNFNFFEYYPKSPKAKSSTMDVYSYIKHLLKLKSERFTKNQLNGLAQTGSSTSNYVVGMENIGLVVNTSEKENSGVIYKINDPKVVYAMKHNLDISRR